MNLLVAEKVKEDAMVKIIPTVEIPYQLHYDLYNNINEDFYRYNYHNRFREFGISKKEMLKTIKIRWRR